MYPFVEPPSTQAAVVHAGTPQVAAVHAGTPHVAVVHAWTPQMSVVHAGARGRAHALPSDLTLELEQRCVCV